MPASKQDLRKALKADPQAAAEVVRTLKTRRMTAELGAGIVCVVLAHARSLLSDSRMHALRWCEIAAMVFRNHSRIARISA